ncbi:hypothetical protein [Streptomyces sp. MBT62]|uniref:hypothetical protein n=1 Tax=Streptomyces sp. MBT62 TaxID=2800410 RepID=UPI00190CF992|nr:hypothetical protein [Streptomyces sp. MBT62]MBK3568894.1 hypothetical protein [Streptomyces sp. MBT62]
MRFPTPAEAPGWAHWPFELLTTGAPDFYGEFARWYCETEPAVVVGLVHRGTPLTQQTVNPLNRGSPCRTSQTT